MPSRTVWRIYALIKKATSTFQFSTNYFIKEFTYVTETLVEVLENSKQSGNSCPAGSFSQISTRVSITVSKHLFLKLYISILYLMFSFCLVFNLDLSVLIQTNLHFYFQVLVWMIYLLLPNVGPISLLIFIKLIPLKKGLALRLKMRQVTSGLTDCKSIGAVD